MAATKAQMALSPDGEHWHLYIVINGEWPEITFPAAAGVPTEADREAALTQLGYRIDTGEWSWAGRFLASVAVRPL
jgi:hypothetical protein